MLKAGKEVLKVKKGSDVYLDAAETLFVCRKEGKKENGELLGRGTRLKLRIAEDMEIVVHAADKTFWTFNEIGEEFRKEVPDQEPIAEMIGYEHPMSLREEMRQFIREEFSNAAAAQNMDTFEEEDDFDDDEEEVVSPYEYAELQDDYIPDAVRPERDDQADAGEDGSVVDDVEEDRKAPEPTEEPQ